MSGSLSASPVSSGFSNDAASSDNRSCSSPLSDRSISVESLVSLLDDDIESLPTTPPPTESRKRKFFTNMDAIDCSSKRAKYASDEERVVMYGRLVLNWYYEVKNQLKRYGTDYEMPRIHLPRIVAEKLITQDDPTESKATPLCPLHFKCSRHKIPLIHFTEIVQTLINERIIQLNRQQAASRRIKKVFTEGQCETCDDLQLLIYERGMEVWRKLQAIARERNDVALSKFSWMQSKDVDLELAVFPIQVYTQLACDTPPLPYLPEFRDFHFNWQ
ncbi:unnamed protein product [Bursaphelenchus okinawaensis]|uniref:Uncharacterized protein n=1 Tax=Bursaphelenchus okinawaensis TaxID=465554 RepID=A0A811KSF7_9BILA|nr:unnamed protein product [Bursaphelenchus okinawaensis]CAG9109632.1 unnamed protein product [Bursaphelenchus okinawaensis]